MYTVYTVHRLVLSVVVELKRTHFDDEVVDRRFNFMSNKRI